AMLWARACDFGHALARLAPATPAVVAIMLPDGDELFAATIGAMLAGHLPALLAAPTRKHPQEAFLGWFAAVLDDSAAQVVVAEAALADWLASPAGPIPGDGPVLLRPPPRGAGAAWDPAEASGEPVDPDRPALLQHSSGTTGLKKGIMLTHRQVLGQVWDLDRALELRPSDVIVSWLPLYHDMGLVACFLLPVLRGVPVVMMSALAWVQRPRMLLEQVAQERGTLTWLPNFALLHLARDASPSDWLDLSSWRGVVSCSERITADAVEAFYEAFAGWGLRYTALSSSYALAESTFAVTQSVLGRGVARVTASRELLALTGAVVPVGDDGPADDRLTLVSSGRALPGCELVVVGEHGEPLAPGQVGRLRIRTPHLLRGYWARRGARPVLDPEGWLDTGDSGVLLDGELYVLGRCDECLVVAGRNLWPDELEGVLGRLEGVCPGRVCVLGPYDPALGTARLVVLAEITHEGAAPEIAQRIRHHVQARYGVTIADVRLSTARFLHKSTSGKMARAANLRDYQRERSRGEPAATPVDPETEPCPST
ncbi:MAG: AMP-binding protein, partial [Myxococcales bacterium]|nr:AMP-binding protein [Myxococcales bacterium]